MATRQLQVNSLTQSGGLITAVLNGQTYTVAVSALTANSLYMIYFTSAGLVVSQSVNSVGPAGYTGWKLVGAFYSSGTAFGNFVGIKGKPQSLWISFPSVAAGTLVTGTGASPVYGTVTNNQAKWRRDGTEFVFEWDFAQSTAGPANQSGSSLTLMNLPTNIVIDVTQKPVNTSATIGLFANSSVGFHQGFYGNNTEVSNAGLVPYSATQIKSYYAFNGSATPTPTTAAVSAAIWSLPNYSLLWRGSAPIVGWTNTPLEDL